MYDARMPTTGPKTPTRLALLCLVTGLFCGCAHRVVVESDPAGATVRIGKRKLGVTPVEFVTVWVPFKKTEATLSIPGHRTMSARLDEDVGVLRIMGEMLTFRWGHLTGITPRRTHKILLMPKHGNSGTWTPEDAQSHQ